MWGRKTGTVTWRLLAAEDFYRRGTSCLSSSRGRRPKERKSIDGPESEKKRTRERRRHNDRTGGRFWTRAAETSALQAPSLLISVGERDTMRKLWEIQTRERPDSANLGAITIEGRREESCNTPNCPYKGKGTVESFNVKLRSSKGEGWEEWKGKRKKA